jgi:hypothetical protein
MSNFVKIRYVVWRYDTRIRRKQIPARVHLVSRTLPVIRRPRETQAPLFWSRRPACGCRSKSQPGRSNAALVPSLYANSDPVEARNRKLVAHRYVVQRRKTRVDLLADTWRHTAARPYNQRPVVPRQRL